MFADFVDFMARKMTDPGLNEDDILDSFSVFDKEKNGLVNAEELKQVLGKMGEIMTTQEVDAIFKDADIDADGNIKYKEFVKKLNEMYELFS
jgi:Ca2+-binding EF-hand superfamily protein